MKRRSIFPHKWVKLSQTSATASEASEHIYAAVTVILQMSGYKMNRVKQKEQRSPWRRLEARIKAAQATEECWERRAKESKLSLPQGQKTAQQRLVAPAAAHLTVYTRDVQAWRINRMFWTEASTASSCQRNRSRGRERKAAWEEEASLMCSALRPEIQRAEGDTEQEPGTQKHRYCARKQSAQMGQVLAEGSHSQWLIEGWMVQIRTPALTNNGSIIHLFTWRPIVGLRWI